jgi:hypothetical protein
MFLRSPSGTSPSSTAAASFSTGTDSPVNGLLDLEIDRLDQTQIGRYVIAGFQQHDIAADNLATGNRHHVTVAHHLGVRRGHFLERGERLFRLRFLHHTDHGVEHHDEQDGNGIHHFPKRQRDERRHDEDDDQVVVDLLPEHRQEAWTRFFGQFVGAEARKTRLRFLLRQAVLRMCLQFARDVLDSFSVGSLTLHG